MGSKCKEPESGEAGEKGGRAMTLLRRSPISLRPPVISLDGPQHGGTENAVATLLR